MGFGVSLEEPLQSMGLMAGPHGCFRAFSLVYLFIAVTCENRMLP